MDNKVLFFKAQPVLSPYTIANAVYNGVFFWYGGINYACNEILFNNDGTKLYWLGLIIFECELSTPYDLSTLVYKRAYNNRTTTSSNTRSRTMAWNNDGTKLFISSEGFPTTIFQFNLSTAFLVTTCTSASISYNFIAETGSYLIHAMSFNNDGTKLFVVANSTIYQYNLATAYDFTTITYSGKSKALSAQGFRFSPDGLVLISLGWGNAVLQYNLSIPYDISTLSYNGVSFNVSWDSPINVSWDSPINGFGLSADFTKLYVGQDGGSKNLYEINL